MIFISLRDIQRDRLRAQLRCWFHYQLTDATGSSLISMLVRGHELFLKRVAPRGLRGPRGTQRKYRDARFRAFDHRVGSYGRSVIARVLGMGRLRPSAAVKPIGTK